MDETKKDEVVVVETVEVDPIAERDEKIAKLTEERDNYKNVALKRLGKLPGDAEFVAGVGTELSVAEQVRLALLDREIEAETKAKDEAVKTLTRENSELKLALKNRPENASIGSGGDGSSMEVKDNMISEAQRVALTAKAVSLKLDPEKFIENFKKNLAQSRK